MSDEKTKKWTDERQLRTSATPEQVYRAWADPVIIEQWFADRARGEAVPGKTIVHEFLRFGFEHRYEVLEAANDERLLLEADFGGRRIRQEIVVERDGGETVMRLIHSGFGADAEWGEEYEGIDSGWKLALALLEHYLENHFGKPRTHYFVMKPASFEYAELAPYYRDEDKLRRWLTKSGGVGDVGSPYRLDLRFAADGRGSSASGHVLAWTGSELCLSWDEIDGALELKAFPAGPGQRMVALSASSWSPEAPEPAPLEGEMEGALERLCVELGDADAIRPTPRPVYPLVEKGP